MTSPPAPAPAPPTPLTRLLPACVCVAGALGLALWRMHTALLPVGTPVTATVVVAVVFAVAAAAVRARRGRLEPMVALLMAASAAFLLSGLVELPKWPSIEAVGRTIGFFPLALGAAAVAWVAAASGPRTPADAGFAVFVLLIACGGSLFVRVADEFHATLLLFAVPLVLAVPGAGRGFLAVPFARLAAAFLVVAALPVVTTVDLDRHLHGWTRVALAVVPLYVLGTGAPDRARAWFAARAFGWSAVAAMAAAGLAVLELVRVVGPRLGLDVRLTLFGEHPNIIAPFFAVAPPLLLALAAGSRRGAGRLGWSVAAALSLGVLVLPRSRAAALGAAVGLAGFALLAVWPWLRRRLGDRRLAVAAVLLAVVGVAGAFAGKGTLARQLENDTMQFRLTMWSTAVDAIEARPWTGYGFLTGDPLMVHAESGDLDGRSKDTHPHDVFLAIALGAGVPAALLFLAWIGMFLLRTARVAVAGAEERWLAAGVVASALALLAANTLDQGLAMHAPVALHLGLLVGIGAVLVRAAESESESESTGAREAESATATAGWRGALGAVGLTAVAVFAVLSMAGDRWMAEAQTDLRRRQDAAAIEAAARAAAAKPFSLAVGLRRVDLLQRAGEVEAARDEIERLVRHHPLSWVPWEKRSMLDWWEGELAASQEALERARALDPTGPLDPTWHLRTAKIRALQGRRDEAVEEMARAFRFDHLALERVPWTEIDSPERGPDRTVTLEEIGRPIRLSRLLEINREAMRETIGEDVVVARRIAMVLVKGYGFLERFDEGRAVIDEFERESTTTWLPMTYLRLWLDRHERELSGAALPDGHNEALKAIESMAGSAGVVSERGRGLLAAGEAAAAKEAFEASLERVYDIVTEKEYVGLALDGLVDAHLALGEYEEADAALERALFLYAGPAQRIERLTSFARAQREAGRTDVALAKLGDAADAARFLAPSPAGRQALRQLGEELVPFAETGADAAIARASGTAAGTILEVRLLNARGRTAEARRALADFELRHPEWGRR